MERPDPERPTSPIRLSDADREAVISDLRVAMAEGRLTMDEFEERSAIVYRSRFNHELDDVRADLPVPITPPAPAPRPSSADRPVSSARTGRTRRWLVAVMSGREWTGRWRPADHNIAISFMGGQDIDLTGLEEDHVEILAFTMMGGTDIIVPRGAEVDHGGFMFMGGLGVDLDPPADPPTMRITVRAWGLMGGVDIYHPQP